MKTMVTRKEKNMKTSEKSKLEEEIVTIEITVHQKEASVVCADLAKLFRNELKQIRKELKAERGRFTTDNVLIMAMYQLVEYQFLGDRMEIANKTCNLLIVVQEMLKDMKKSHPNDAKYYLDAICDVDEIILLLDERVHNYYGNEEELLAA